MSTVIRSRAVRHVVGVLSAVLLVVAAGGTYASPSDQPEEPSEDRSEFQVGGYVQLWWTILEQVENGLLQPLSGDKAVEEVSGFSFRRVRINGDFSRGSLKGRISVRLEGSPPGLLDASAGLPLLGRRAELWVGQMKIPSTYEVAISSAELDFVTRSQLSQRIADFSLSRSPFMSHPRFHGVVTYLRDLGVALKGELYHARYFLMIGNGLGSNRYVGGRERKQEVFANAPGAHFYGARVAYELHPPGSGSGVDGLLWSADIGSHVTWNHHPDIVLNDERTVLDINRSSWSADAHVQFGTRVHLTGMIAGGIVDDDFDHDGRTDYRYRGWEAKAIAEAVPGRLRLGLRYDVYKDEYHENGAEDTRSVYTFGATWTPRSDVRFHLDYKINTLDSRVDPDIGDDSLILAGQLIL